MDDLISRQDALKTAHLPTIEDAGYEVIRLDDILTLPSAQSEIIQCQKCKFASGDSRICMKFGHSPIGELDFCAWAERRTDG